MQVEQAVAGLYGTVITSSTPVQQIVESADIVTSLALRAGRRLLAEQGDEPQHLLVDKEGGITVVGKTAAARISADGSTDVRRFAADEDADEDIRESLEAWIEQVVADRLDLTETSNLDLIRSMDRALEADDLETATSIAGQLTEIAGIKRGEAKKICENGFALIRARHLAPAGKPAHARVPFGPHHPSKIHVKPDGFFKRAYKAIFGGKNKQSTVGSRREALAWVAPFGDLTEDGYDYIADAVMVFLTEQVAPALDDEQRRQMAAEFDACIQTGAYADAMDIAEQYARMVLEPDIVEGFFVGAADAAGKAKGRKNSSLAFPGGKPGVQSTPTTWPGPANYPRTPGRIKFVPNDGRSFTEGADPNQHPSRMGAGRAPNRFKRYHPSNAADQSQLRAKFNWRHHQDIDRTKPTPTFGGGKKKGFVSRLVGRLKGESDEETISNMIEFLNTSECDPELDREATEAFNDPDTMDDIDAKLDAFASIVEANKLEDQRTPLPEFLQQISGKPEVEAIDLLSEWLNVEDVLDTVSDQVESYNDAVESQEYALALEAALEIAEASGQDVKGLKGKARGMFKGGKFHFLPASDSLIFRRHVGATDSIRDAGPTRVAEGIDELDDPNYHTASTDPAVRSSAKRRRGGPFKRYRPADADDAARLRMRHGRSGAGLDRPGPTFGTHEGTELATGNGHNGRKSLDALKKQAQEKADEDGNPYVVVTSDTNEESLVIPEKEFDSDYDGEEDYKVLHTAQPANVAAGGTDAGTADRQSDATDDDEKGIKIEMVEAGGFQFRVVKRSHRGGEELYTAHHPETGRIQGLLTHGAATTEDRGKGAVWKAFKYDGGGQRPHTLLGVHYGKDGKQEALGSIARTVKETLDEGKPDTDMHDLLLGYGYEKKETIEGGTLHVYRHPDPKANAVGLLKGDDGKWSFKVTKPGTNPKDAEAVKTGTDGETLDKYMIGHMRQSGPSFPHRATPNESAAADAPVIDEAKKPVVKDSRACRLDNLPAGKDDKPKKPAPFRGYEAAPSLAPAGSVAEALAGKVNPAFG